MVEEGDYMKISNVRAWAVICCAVFFPTGSVFAEDALTINSPLERQVTQRTEQNQADITISGVTQGAADAIEAKADLATGITHGLSLIHI